MAFEIQKLLLVGQKYQMEKKVLERIDLIQKDVDWEEELYLQQNHYHQSLVQKQDKHC